MCVIHVLLVWFGLVVIFVLHFESIFFLFVCCRSLPCIDCVGSCAFVFDFNLVVVAISQGDLGCVNNDQSGNKPEARCHRSCSRDMFSIILVTRFC